MLEAAQVVVFLWLARSALWWGSIALVARNQPRNRFARALFWSPAVLAVVYVTASVVPIHGAVLTATAIAIYTTAHLVVVVWQYRLGVVRAVGAVALFLAGWYALGFVMQNAVPGNAVVEQVVLTGVPMIVGGSWWWYRHHCRLRDRVVASAT